MIKYLIAFFMLLPTIIFSAIAEKATTDSLSLPFAVFDSSGSMKTLGAGDSLGIVVFSPEQTVVFSEQILYNNAKIATHFFTAREPLYTYSNSTSALVGASTTEGVFTWFILVHDTTDAALNTPFSGQFQIIRNNYAVAVDTSIIAKQSTSDIIKANLDTSMYISNTWFTSGSAITRTSDSDYIKIYSPGTTTVMGRITSYHMGKTAGAAPDSVRVVFGI